MGKILLCACLAWLLVNILSAKGLAEAHVFNLHQSTQSEDSVLVQRPSGRLPRQAASLTLNLNLARPHLTGFALDAQDQLEISLQHNSDREARTKSQLQKLLKEYPLSKWLFTKRVVIDEQAIPHSHPVLTLHTRHLNNDLALLSTFIHEQIHWFEEMHPEQRDQAIKELKTIFPDAPSGPPEGARDRDSTYLHLIVCYLEYEGMKELVGNEKAREVVEETAKFLYRWVYRTVLGDGPKIKAVVEKHRLKL